MAALIDTNIAIFLRDNNRTIWNAVRALPEAPSLSVLTCVELESGVAAAPEQAASRRSRIDLLLEMLPILPFTSDEAATYGRIVAQCGFSRAKIIDRMIAATAIVAGIPLITLNPRDFRGVPGLRVEDWSQERA